MRIQPKNFLLGLLVFAATGCAGLNDQLFEAIVKGDRARMQTLIEEGADAKAANTLGATPLHIAAEKGHREIVALLLERGADVRATSREGLTPLHQAAWQGHREIVEWLVAKGADVKATSTKGVTPLHSAAGKGHREIVGLLLDKGADVKAATTTEGETEGATPLHMAAAMGHREVVELLLAKGAEKGAKTKMGESAVDLARRQGHSNLVAILSPETKLADLGKSLYEGKGTCHACHGKTGKGDGPAGQRLTPKPTDLTNPQALRFKTDAERLHVLKNGIPGTGMVSLVPIVISEEEAAAVITYLHTLLGEP